MSDLKSSASADSKSAVAPTIGLPLLVLAISLVSTVVAWYTLRDATDRNAKTQFEASEQRGTMEIEHRMRAYEHTLRAVAGMVSRTTKLERSEWHDFVAELELDRYYPGIQAIGYAEVIKPHELQDHLARIRGEGFNDYAIRPEGARDIYTAISHVEPFSGANLRALGYDMFAETTRRAAMERARDTGEAALSGKVVLIQDTEQTKKQAGTLLYLPVYRLGVVLDSVNARRAALRGYVYAAFRMTDLITNVLGERFSKIDLEIFDGAQASPQALLFDGDATLNTFAKENAVRLQRSKQISVAGQPWTLMFFAHPGYLGAQFGITPGLALLGGTLMSLLLFAMTWLQANSRARAQALAQEMSKTAEQSAAHLDGIIRGAAEAIITVDEDQAVVLFNPAAEALFQCSAQDAIGSSLERFIPNRFHGAHRGHVANFGRTGTTTRAMGAKLDLYAIRANGEEFPIDASISKTEQDGKRFFTVLLRDITRRKHAEQAIAESNQFNQEILTNVNEGIVVYDRNLNVVVWNPFMEKLSGLKSAEANGKHIYELFRNLREQSAHDAMLRALAGESVVASEPVGRYRGTLDFLPASAYQQALDDSRIAWTVTTWAPHRNHQNEIVGVVVTVLDVTELKHSQDGLRQSNAKLRELSEHLESTREAERTRIAREIHDELAGTLTGIKMDLSSARDVDNAIPSELRDKLARSVQLVDIAVQTTRRIINDLRPSLLDNLGVWAAIEWLVAELGRDTMLKCETEIEETIAQTELPPAMSTALFRIVQESLSNVRRHAEATLVRVRAYRDGSRVVVEIVDNGRGLTEADVTKAGHWGVMGMHERAVSHGGEVHITSAPGAGTTVRVVMPLSE
jgi:PAS domain S-box-containing protein